MTRLYLDHNAGAPVRADALAAAVAAAEAGGNPSSVHGEGRAARRRIEEARREVALLGGVAPARVVFTSGATEANATGLSPRLRLGAAEIRVDRLLVGATEHPSVLAGGRFAAQALEPLPVDGDGVIDRAHLARRLAECRAAGETVLVAVQLANSETGVIQPIAEIAGLVHAAGALLHCDAVQAAGRIALDDPALDVDMLSLSAHKIGGLPGVGALLLRRPDLELAPLLPGGGQESNRRAGTQNTPGIVAFGVAAAAARAGIREITQTVEKRDWLETQLRIISGDVKVFGAGAPRIANTTMVAVPGVAAETAVIAFDLEGIAVSAGSACSSGKVGPSHVAQAMGLGADLIRSGIRISLGRETTRADLERLVATWAEVMGRLART
ncbi:cysteine desulfurase [Siculibacillus lacustris]|uniref:Cysteine desulfurase n=1 Tax=Siculibacillus lacustris TaxID=1549641 RepID=A0A4V2KTS4_9HYPH|nr:cysteine desulfurase family protein [Siculibacillus lacustris]TBW38457.1 cysteine desulfurase [Siculibacillus lacustris]